MPRIAYGSDELFVALGVTIVSIAELRVAEGRVDYLSVGDEIRVADAEVMISSYFARAAVSSDSVGAEFSAKRFAI